MPRSTYSGEMTGLDLSWTSDLNDAQVPAGETVGGTTADDQGEETTTVGTADDTPLQRQIKTDHLCHPGASYSEIADRVGCSPSYVQQTLCLSDDQPLTRERFAELSATQQQIIEMAVHNNGLSQADIAAWHDVSQPYVSQILSQNEHIVAAIERGESDR